MVGLKYEGHIQYTAARTRLISEKVGKWADTLVDGGFGKSIDGEDAAEVKSGDGDVLAGTEISENKSGDKESGNSKSDVLKQVVNLGAGVDTRAYWDEALRNCALYIEIDTAEVNDYKSDVLEGLRKQQLKEKRLKEQQLKESGDLGSDLGSSDRDSSNFDSMTLTTICQRRAVVSMDFSKESVKDLPKHKEAGFDPLSPSCWILEGLVMYLTRDDNIKLLEEISSISSKGSYLILNFVANQPTCNPDDHDELLKENGWVREERLMFGDDGFNFGKYPPNQEPNETYGFSFYRKVRFAAGYWTGEGNGREWVPFSSK
jgi:O-methyltransferase involved in polyketide biosynthesis